MRAPAIRSRADAGFSLIEGVVAAAVLISGVVGLAQLFVVTATRNAGARRTTVATFLARQKLEQLYAEAWGASGPDVSPAGSLVDDRSGFVDYLNGDGAPLADGPGAPPGARFVRRWSVEPLAVDPDGAVVLQVLVQPWPPAVSGSGRLGGPGWASIVGVRAREDEGG